MEQEKTILEESTTEDVDLFGDDEPSVTDDDMFDTEEIDEPSDETEQEYLEEGEPTSVIKIKYNGKEESLDIGTQYDEIVALIQKGKNYDHIVEERNALKESPELKELTEIAKEVGVNDVRELVAKLKQDLYEQKVNTRVKELTEEGMSEKHARHVAELELEKSNKDVEPLPSKSDPQVEDQKQLFVELFEEYPELIKLAFEDYPKEVVEMIEQGKKPLIAYQKYLLEKEKKEKEKFAHISTVKSRNVGSLKSSKDENADDFLSEFDS